MPKETIRTRQGNGNFKLEVGWAVDQEVQLRIVLDPSDSSGPQTIHALFENTPDIPEWQALSFLFDWQSRQQINDLIKALRRARDNAFGRDE